MMLDVAFAIQAPSGWVELEDPANGYEAHKETRAEQGVSWRKQEITSTFVEGTNVNDAVKENVTESVAIYVDAPTSYVLAQRIKVLTDALSQIRYSMRFRNGNLLETWDCAVADYTIETPQEMINSTMAVVRASVPRRPTVTMAQVP
jgi:hypothetical protein